MSFMKAGRLFQLCLVLPALALSGCGFHLRQNAALPAAMQQVHITLAGQGEFERILTRALRNSGATVVDEAGPGVAELQIPVAAFNTETLSAGGYVRISEYAIHYRVQFDVTDANGQILVPSQTVIMQREYSYNATNTIGNDSQVQQIQHSLNNDMTQAILFRLQAAARHPTVAPSTPAASSSASLVH